MHPLTTLTIAFLRLGTLVILLIFQAAGLSYARDYSSLIVKPSEPRLGGEWSGVQYWSAGEQKRNKAFELHFVETKPDVYTVDGTLVVPARNCHLKGLQAGGLIYLYCPEDEVLVSVLGEGQSVGCLSGVVAWVEGGLARSSGLQLCRDGYSPSQDVIGAWKDSSGWAAISQLLVLGQESVRIPAPIQSLLQGWFRAERVQAVFGLDNAALVDLVSGGLATGAYVISGGLLYKTDWLMPHFLEKTKKYSDGSKVLGLKRGASRTLSAPISAVLIHHTGENMPQYRLSRLEEGVGINVPESDVPGSTTALKSHPEWTIIKPANPVSGGLYTVQDGKLYNPSRQNRKIARCSVPVAVKLDAEPGVSLTPNTLWPELADPATWSVFKKPYRISVLVTKEGRKEGQDFVDLLKSHRAQAKLQVVAPDTVWQKGNSELVIIPETGLVSQVEVRSKGRYRLECPLAKSVAASGVPVIMIARSYRFNWGCEMPGSVSYKNSNAFLASDAKWFIDGIYEVDQPASGVVKITTENVDLVEQHWGDCLDGGSFLARHPTDTEYWPIMGRNQCGFWGVDESPEGYTESGLRLFVNLVSHLASGNRFSAGGGKKYGCAELPAEANGLKITREGEVGGGFSRPGAWAGKGTEIVYSTGVIKLDKLGPDAAQALTDSAGTPLKANSDQLEVVDDILYFVQLTPGQLHAMNLSNGQLVTHDGHDFSDGFTVSPDHSTVVYGRRGILFARPVLGGEETELGKGAQPQYSPEGDWLIFVRDKDLYLMRPDGTEESRLTFDESSRSPDFSPDGRKIVYAKDTVYGRMGSRQLAIVDRYSGEQEVLLDNKYLGHAHPQWSPDGNHIAFGFGPWGHVSTYVIGLTEGAGYATASQTDRLWIPARAKQNIKTCCTAPSLSEENLLVVADVDGQLYNFDLTNGELRPFGKAAGLPATAVSIAIAPGSSIALLDSTGVGKYSVDNGQTWLTMAFGPAGQDKVVSITACPKTPFRLYARTSSALYISGGKGQSWTQLKSGSDISGVAVLGSESGWTYVVSSKHGITGLADGSSKTIFKLDDYPEYRKSFGTASVVDVFGRYFLGLGSQGVLCRKPTDRYWSVCANGLPVGSVRNGQEFRVQKLYAFAGDSKRLFLSSHWGDVYEWRTGRWHFVGYGLEGQKISSIQRLKNGRIILIGGGDEPSILKLSEDLQRTTLENAATFDSGSAVPKEGLEASLTKIVDEFGKYHGGHIRIEGHTDSVGYDRENLELSRARAETVKNILIGAGVPADSITTVGFGELRPVVPNATPEGRSRNRRVDVLLTW